MSLALYGEELDPDEVTRILGLPPSSAHRRGDRRGPKSPPYRKGAWFLEERGVNQEPVLDVVRRLLGALPQAPAIWLELHSRYEVHLRFGLFMSEWNRGFELSRDVVARIAETGAEMVFDIYADGRSP